MEKGESLFSSQKTDMRRRNRHKLLSVNVGLIEVHRTISMVRIGRMLPAVEGKLMLWNHSDDTDD